MDVSQFWSCDAIYCLETGFSQKYTHIYVSLGKFPTPYLSLTIKCPVATQVHLLDLEGSSLIPYS